MAILILLKICKRKLDFSNLKTFSIAFWLIMTSKQKEKKAAFLFEL
jgi:hypothetical protein